MRWIALWLLLTCAYLIGLGVSWLAAGQAPTRAALLHLLVVPPAQLLALRVVMSVRQASADGKAPAGESGETEEVVDVGEP